MDYYLEHGRNLLRSIKALGYPHRETLKLWLDEAIPNRQGLRGRRSLGPRVELTPQQKEEAVLDLCSRDGPAKEVAKKYGVSRVALYSWKKHLLGKEPPVKKSGLSDEKDALPAKVKSLKEEVEALQKQVHRLRLNGTSWR